MVQKKVRANPARQEKNSGFWVQGSGKEDPARKGQHLGCIHAVDLPILVNLFLFLFLLICMASKTARNSSKEGLP